MTGGLPAERAAFFGVIDARLAAKLAAAIAVTQRRRRSDGLPPDSDLDLFVRALVGAYGGPAGTSFGDLEDSSESEDMRTSPRLLTYEEVAQRLAISERQVKRLVADTSLVAVHIGAAARVHTDDLQDFMESLRTSERISA